MTSTARLTDSYVKSYSKRVIAASLDSFTCML